MVGLLDRLGESVGNNSGSESCGTGVVEDDVESILSVIVGGGWCFLVVEIKF
jgi:hypothetical protein